jgi:hypothetical protein
LLPDDWTYPTDISSSSSQTFSTNVSTWANTYTTADWVKMQTAGAVFFPAAAYREGTSVKGNKGNYWLATASGDSRAYRQYFDTGDVDGDSYYNRNLGFFVRLVQDK